MQNDRYETMKQIVKHNKFVFQSFNIAKNINSPDQQWIIGANKLVTCNDNTHLSS